MVREEQIERLGERCVARSGPSVRDEKHGPHDGEDMAVVVPERGENDGEVTKETTRTRGSMRGPDGGAVVGIDGVVTKEIRRKRAVEQ